MLSDDDARRRMGLVGQKRVQEEFTFTTLAAKYVELFERLSNGGVAQAALRVSRSENGAAGAKQMEALRSHA
jgi:hypothetical protein